MAYLDTCPSGEVPRVNRALGHFGAWQISDVTNDAVRDFARVAYPPGPSERASALNATINREVVTPVSAIVHAGGLERRFRRYKEPSGRVRVDPPETVAVFLEALPERYARKLKKGGEGPARFPRALALFVLCCNARRNDAFMLDWLDVDLGRSQAHLRHTKNGEPRSVHLPAVVVAALADLPHREGRVFQYRSIFTINKDWQVARKIAAKTHPRLADLSPHGARHLFASWARQQGADLKKLMDMGGWKDVKSVLRYQHVPSHEVKAALDASPLNKAARPPKKRGNGR